AGAGTAEVRVLDPADVAAGPAEILPLLHRGDHLRRGVVAQVVAAVDGRPQVAAVRRPGDPDRVAQALGELLLPGAVRVVAHDRGAPRVLLVADVAGGADGDVHLSVRAEDDRAGPVAGAGGQVRDDGLEAIGAQVVVVVAGADDAVRVGDVQVAVVPGQPVRPVQPRGKRLHRVRDAVVVTIG